MADLETVLCNGRQSYTYNKKVYCNMNTDASINCEYLRDSVYCNKPKEDYDTVRVVKYHMYRK